MDRAVLAHLERQPVQAERAHLPDEVLDVAVDGALEAHLHERVADLVKLVKQRGSGLVRGRTVRARLTEALGHVREAPSKWFVGETALLFARQVGHQPHVACQALGQPPPSLRLDRDRLGQASRDILIGVHDVVELDGHRCARHLRGDARVAVPVTADPRTEAQERRHGRARGSLQRSVDARHDDEERLVEERHCAAHLVERAGRSRADRNDVPQERDLLAQPAP